MEYGNIVFSGAEEGAKNYLGVPISPVINILPNSDQIYSEVKKLLLNIDIIDSMKINSIKYVFNVHNYNRVGSSFVDVYAKLLENKL